MLTLRAGSFGSLRNSPSPVASHRQVLLEECAVVAVLLRRILWRRAARRNQTLHRAAGDTAIVAAYPGLKSRACATHWGSSSAIALAFSSLTFGPNFGPANIALPSEIFLP